MNSVTANGVACEVIQYTNAEDVQRYCETLMEEEGLEELNFADAFALVGIKYDKEAAMNAATKTQVVEYGEGDTETYPVISCKFNCTGTLNDGTEVEELFCLNYYFMGYGGFLGWF